MSGQNVRKPRNVINKDYEPIRIKFLSQILSGLHASQQAYIINEDWGIWVKKQKFQINLL